MRNNSTKKSTHVIVLYITELSLTILFEWTAKIVSNDGFQAIKRNYEIDIARKHALMTVMLKK